MDLILTISMEITMTMNDKIEWTPTVFNQNDVFNLDPDEVGFLADLSAASIPFRGVDHSIGKLYAMSIILENIHKSKLELDLGMILTKSYRRPVTRVSRYKGLWKFLEQNGINIPQYTHLKAMEKEFPEKVSFSALIDAKIMDADMIIKIASHVSTCLFLSRNHTDIFEASSSVDLEKRINIFSRELIILVEKFDMVIISFFGAADDIESGCTLLGPQSVLKRLFFNDLKL